eukprot:c33412_g1_i1 orf=2-226(-)
MSYHAAFLKIEVVQRSSFTQLNRAQRIVFQSFDQLGFEDNGRATLRGGSRKGSVLAVGTSKKYTGTDFRIDVKNF